MRSDDGYQKINQLWLPRFKLYLERPERDPSFLGLHMNAQGEVINECFQQFSMELYGPPLSEGTIQVSYDSRAQDTYMVGKPFYLAITHSAIEDALETPLIVAKIGQHHWQKAT